MNVARSITYGFVVLAVVTALACEPGAERSARRNTDSAVVLAADERDLAPESDMPVKMLLFSTLTSLNAGGVLEPRMARRWQHSADGREWTYHLRPDIKWHDGARFTAHDIAASVALWRHPELQHYYTAFVEAAHAIDDSTVVIRYTTSIDLSIASYLTFLPRHIIARLEPKEFHRWDYWRQPIGNGPYRVARVLPGTALELAANDEYYRGRPRIDRVVLRFTGEHALTDLLAGNVDAVSWTNPAEISKFAADPRFRVYFSPESYRGFALYWNNADSRFADARVRRALTLAIDRRAIARARNQPDEIPLFDAPFTDRQLRQGRVPPNLSYDSAEARRLLDLAGWRDVNGDGVREKAARPLAFTMLVWDFGRNEVAVLVQEQLRRVGVQVQLQPLDRAQVTERFRDGRFEAVLTAYDNNPGSLKRLRLGSGAPLGYNNREVAALVERAVSSADLDLRDRIYEDLALHLRRDLPITFIGPRVNVVFAHRRLRGLATPWKADPAWYMDELWLEEREG